jgi:hypothetical protein
MQSMQNQKKHKFTTPKLLSSFQNNISSILACSNNPSRAASLGQTAKKKNSFFCHSSVLELHGSSKLRQLSRQDTEDSLTGLWEDGMLFSE